MIKIRFKHFKSNIYFSSNHEINPFRKLLFHANIINGHGFSRKGGKVLIGNKT